MAVRGVGGVLWRRRKRLVVEGRRDRLLDHDERVFRALVAGIASGGELTVGHRELETVLRLDGLAKLGQLDLDERADGRADAYIAKRRIELGQVGERVVQPLKLVFGKIPVVHGGGKPEL